MIRTIAAAVLTLAMPLAAQTVREKMLVSTEWLNANRLTVKVLEIGDPATYDKGHIPGAVLIPMSSLVTQLDENPNQLPPIAQLESLFTNAGIGWRGRIVLYSRDPIDAARAWFTLDYLGYGERTAILDGGINRWIAEGRSLSTEPVIPKPSPFHPTIHPQVLVRFPAVRDAVRVRDTVSPWLVLIDARSPAQYAGDEAGADVQRPGHIPGAVNIPWPSNFTAGENPVLRSPDELRKIYESAGVAGGTRNIVYCRTGMQASVTYFTLRYLGCDAALYDGSFVEWSRSGQLVE